MHRRRHTRHGLVAGPIFPHQANAEGRGAVAAAGEGEELGTGRGGPGGGVADPAWPGPEPRRGGRGSVTSARWRAAAEALGTRPADKGPAGGGWSWPGRRQRGPLRHSGGVFSI